jgi:hypothetical protein
MPRTTPKLSLALLLGVSPLAAQGLTADSAGCIVQAGLGAPVTVPSGTNLDFGGHLTTGNQTGGASLRIEHRTTTTSLGLRWTLACNASHAGTVMGQGAVRYELTAPEPVAGELRVVWSHGGSGSGASQFMFDLFDDQLDLVAGSAVFPVWLGPSPLPFRVQAGVSASAGTVAGPWGTTWSYQGAANGVLEVTFVPTHCSSVGLGPGCGDPQLSIVGNLLGGADLCGAFGPASAIGVAVLGFDQQTTTLPMGPGCALATTPVVALWGLPDAQGLATWSIGLPASVRPLAFAAQLLGFDPVGAQATTSAPMRVVCQ